MSDEPVILTVEAVKKKLKKYTALQEHAKVTSRLSVSPRIHFCVVLQVKEYLRKLHHTSVTSSLIQVKPSTRARHTSTDLIS